MLNFALEYARRGWPVLPLFSVIDGVCTCHAGVNCTQKPGKHPMLNKWQHRASTDETQIRKWFSGTRPRNIGILMGAASGLVAVDCDSTEAMQEALKRGLPETLTVETGRGYHFLYKHPGGRVGSGTKILKKVMPDLPLDIKGDDGYIVAPPSLHISGKRYQWAREQEPSPLPQWIVDLQQDKTPVEVPRKRGVPLPDVSHLLVEQSDYQRAVEALAFIDPDQSYDDWVHVGMALHSTDEPSAFDEWDRWSSRGNKYKGIKDIDTHWKSFDSSGITIATIFDLAKRAGWCPTPAPVAVVRRPSLDPGILPASLLSVPGFVDDVVEYTMRTCAYPNRALALAGALALQSFLAGRKVTTDDCARSSLYLMGLADSGVGKQAPRATNIRVLTALGLADKVYGSLASGEGVEDTLVNVRSALFQPDELDSLIAQLAEDLPGARRTAGILKDLFTSAHITYTARVKANRDGKPMPRASVDQPSLTLLGNCPAELFYSALNERLAVDGFLSRCLIFESGARGKRRRFKDEEPPARVMEHAVRWVDAPFGPGNLSEMTPTPRVVPYTSEAERLLESARDHFDALYDAAPSNVIRTQWTRAAEKAARLALVAACSASVDNPVIGANDVEWAVLLVEHLTRRTLHMVGSTTAANPFDKQCLKLVGKLSADKDTKRHEVSRAMRLPVKELDEVIKALIERGEIVQVSVLDTGGRTAVAYRLAR